MFKPSLNRIKALPTNSQACLYAPVNARHGEPTGAGYHDTVSPSVCVQPYCEGPPGSRFAVRLWGLGNFQDDWYYYLLAELGCTSCARQEPDASPRPRYMSGLERFCNAITLVRGSALVLSYPGTNLPGYVEVRSAGTKKIFFDFQNQDPVSMNCYWAPCF